MKTLERCQEKLDEFRRNGLKLVRKRHDCFINIKREKREFLGVITLIELIS